jgi:hypothetical protein
VRVVAGARVRYLVRSRVILLAVLLAVLPWFALEKHEPDSELGLLTGSLLVGIITCAGGVVAEPLDEGWYGIGVLHGLQPIELILGEALGGLAGLMPVVTAFAALSASSLAGIPPLALLLCLGWLATLVLGWLSLMLALGSSLRGKGNAIALIPLLVAFAFPSDALPLDRWPAWAASAVRAVWDAMPLESHATAMYAALLHDATPPRSSPIALLLAPPTLFVLALFRLTRHEAARRVTA